MEFEIEIKIDCSGCSYRIKLKAAEAQFDEYTVLEVWANGEVLFNISQDVLVSCPNCGEERFIPYTEFVALCYCPIVDMSYN